jgi:hypothetical protein
MNRLIGFHSCLDDVEDARFVSRKSHSVLTGDDEIPLFHDGLLMLRF